MKLTTFLLLFAVIQVMGFESYSQGTKLSLNFKNTSLKEVLSSIEDKTEYYFLYSSKIIDVDRMIDVNINGKSISEALDQILKDTDIEYVFKDRQILLSSKSNQYGLFENTQQQKNISGKVTDSAGGVLPGVSVVIKGTTVGTITDSNGNYSLSDIPANSTLQFSFVGMKTQEFTISGKTSINVILVEEVIGIEEVVAIGYGTQKKREVTSAVASIKKDDFNKGAAVSSPLQLIQGKVAGLAISRSNAGDPNSGVEIQLRGVSTVMGTSSPLVIIDGVPGGNLNTISPEDIESIDVLRDGSAAAIYGTRGTNGVVLITTKKGMAGKPTVEYSSYVYTEVFSKKPDVLNGEEWRKMKIDFQNSPVKALKDRAGSIVDYGANTDWFKEVARQAVSHVHNLSVSGGNEHTNYYAAVNYRNLQGIVKRSFNDFLNGRLSISHLGLNDKLKVEMTLSNTLRKSRPTDYEVYRQSMQRNPTLPVYNSDGTYNEVSGYQLFNPVAHIYQNENDQQRNELLANVLGTYEVIKDLKFSVLGAMQKSNNIMGAYIYKNAFNSINSGSNGMAARSANQSVDRTLETTLNYNKTIKGKHSLNLMAGYSYQDFVYEAFGASNRYFITDDFLYNNLGAGLNLRDGVYKEGDIWSQKNSSKLIAFFSRAIYSFDDKYMFSTSIRREGSSKFGKNHKWGLFPSVTAGWRISKEKFMQGFTNISDLKLRFGYGVTGNQGIGDYISLERLTTGGMMLYNGQWIPGYVPASNPNPDLRWEKKSETNIGIDIGLFENKITANIDLYNRTTTDLLFNYAVPVPPNLYNTMWTNVGEVKNQGIEFTLNTAPIKTGKFNWNSNFNISYNKNKLVSLSNDIYKTKYQDLEVIGSPGLNAVPAFRLEEGQPIGNMYSYVFAGFTDEGKWLFWDKNHEKKLTSTQVKDEDKKVTGNGLPKCWMGFTNTFTYGNLDMTIFFRGAFGFQIVNTQRIFFENRNMVPLNILTDALTSPVIDDPQYSDYYVEKGDYVKLDNVTLGYKFPLMNKVVQSMRIYIAGQNLATFTKYKGQDPELQIMGLTPGMDRRGAYPATRTFSLGANIVF